jgi:adenine-specific DNA-methyltransferase
MNDDRLLAAKKKFSRLLKEIFQFDCADLDFGIYRILAMRRTELEHFLDNELLPQVEGILASAVGDKATVQGELAKLESTLRDAGIREFSSSPKWNELKGKLSTSPDVAALAREVFSDLTTFFGRYYDEGDFMALPRYKGDTYAIPYDGSEVKLHWANADQYYIKTTEQHADYTAVIDGVEGLERPRLRFRLAAAESDRDNNKSTEKRRYLLRAARAVEIENNQLIVWFEYRVPEPGSGRQPTQSALCEEAEKAVLAAVPPAWQAALTRKASQNPEKYTVLGYQLYRYTKRNTSDYFIHKNLGGFLRRELDFFIKNEVLFLDDIEGRTSAEIDVALQKVRALRAVGRKIVDWLAQIEDFQKKLYLKKKFVLRSNWVVPLRHVPTELHGKVMEVQELVASWSELFGDDLDQIRSNTSQRMRLPVDTTLLPPRVARELKAAMGDMLDTPTGLIVSSENYQALRLLRASYGGRCQLAYLDPPYNTGGDGFLYRDGYRESSWTSMILDRLKAGVPLLSDDSALFVSIDEHSNHTLKRICRALFGESNEIGEIAICLNPKGRQLNQFFATSHESLLVYAKDAAQTALVAASADEVDQSAFPLVENGVPYRLLPLRNTNKKFNPQTRPNLYYPLFIDPDDGSVNTTTNAGFIEVYPIFGSGEPAVWRWGKPKSEVQAGELLGRLVNGREGERWDVFQKDFCPPERTKKLNTFWTSDDAGSTDGAVAELKALGCSFTSPKPTKLVTRLLSLLPSDAFVVDYFAGSGTTAAAVLAANARDDGDRRFLVVEMGEHVRTTLMPRLKKLSFSSSWQDGRPTAQGQLAATETWPVLRVDELESYDDSLENILLNQPDVGRLFESPGVHEDYTLRYMLNLEAEGSLLDLERFRKPWDYTIKVRRDGVVQDSPVDLVETFNYLIGLRVRRYDTYGQEGLLFVIGTDPEGRRVIIVWRDCDLWPNDRVEEKCRQAFESFRPNEFDLVYVNGDNHLPIIKTGEESWKVNLIEETFHARMFDTSDVE